MAMTNEVATLNAENKMVERMMDLLISITRITDYVDSSDIEITTDFANGWVEVDAGDFTITYLINDTPYVRFDESGEFNSIDLSDIIEMLDYNEEVEMIFHAIKNEMFN